VSTAKHAGMPVEDRPRLIRYIENLTIYRVVLTIAAVSITLTVAGAVVADLVEPKTFTSFGDAMWWALQTVSTVGYGDVVPSHTGGRLVGSVLMLLGLAFVPALTSIVVAILTARTQTRLRQARGDDAEVLKRLARIERALGVGDEPS
jgi:voltage-gated potassium channel Kch